MDRLAAIAVIALVMTTGFVSALNTLKALIKRKENLGEFSELAAKYFQSEGRDDGAYLELIHRSVRMQREMGAHGIMSMFRPPFAGYAIPDYPILLNMLPEYRKCVSDWALRGQAQHYAHAIRESLLRYSGSLEEFDVRAQAELRSPVAWLKEGTRSIVSLPIRLLRGLGIVSERLESAILGSILVRLGSGLVALVTVVAGVVQILTGWDATVALARRILRL